ncbi:MAG: hypothetical protein JST59_25725 [Actinobacteria bacterium]|nr:hypothetical protein [Actinomycetota bacterium]
MSEGEPVSGLSADQPIRGAGEDLLGRGLLVDLLKDEIRGAPTNDGFVMALTAPWGEGKTSVLNLVADGLADEMVVIRFNPWLYSDTEALVIRFFGELGAQVQKNQSLRRVGKHLLSYGQSLAPLGSLLAGPAASVAGQSLAALVALGSRGVIEEGEQLRNALLQRERRILVLVDDIDRLHPDEILDVLRLVKLVGDLPYVTYLLAFDRPYVEGALGRGTQFGGRSYLEKMIQVSYDLPAIRPSELEGILLAKLNAVISRLEYLPINDVRWSELLGRGIAPFFRNLRDVARYVSGVSTRVRLLGQEVALEDILGLEVLRVFEPEVHQKLPGLVDALTKQRTDLFINEDTTTKREQGQIAELLAAASEPRRDQVRVLLGQLFPLAFESHFGRDRHVPNEWRAARRVAYAPAFRAYLHATLDPGAASYATVTEVVEVFGQRDKLRDLLANLQAEQLGDLVQRFPDFASRVNPASISSGISELLRTRHRLSDEWEGLRPAPQLFLKRAMQSAAEVLPKGEDREAALRHAFDLAETDSDRYAIFLWFGTHPQRGRKESGEFLSEAVTQELEEDLRARLRLWDLKDLMGEDEFAWLVVLAYGHDEEGRRRLDELADDACCLALLRSCVGFSIDGQSSFSVAKAEHLFERPVLSRRVARMGNGDLSENDRNLLGMAERALADLSQAKFEEQGGSPASQK